MKTDSLAESAIKRGIFRCRRPAHSHRWARNRRSAHRPARSHRSARNRRWAHNRRPARIRKRARSSDDVPDGRHAVPAWQPCGSESAPSGCSCDASVHSSCRSRRAHNRRSARSHRWAHNRRRAHKLAHSHRWARSHRSAHNHKLARSSCHGPDGDQTNQPRKQYRDTTRERPTGHTGRSYDSLESLLDTGKQTAGKPQNPLFGGEAAEAAATSPKHGTRHDLVKEQNGNF